MRLKISCRWFGIQLLIKRGWSPWHNHDWDAITLFPGRCLEQVDASDLSKIQKDYWLINVVPFHRWHRVKYPLFMLILHGPKIQEHREGGV